MVGCTTIVGATAGRRQACRPATARCPQAGRGRGAPRRGAQNSAGVGGLVPVSTGRPKADEAPGRHPGSAIPARHAWPLVARAAREAGVAFDEERMLAAARLALKKRRVSEVA